MVTQARVHLFTVVLLLLVQRCDPVCVDATSETEAVVGKPMLLTCIFCLKREEVKVKTRVDWYYRPIPGNETQNIHIYKYVNDTPEDLDGPFKDRLTWNGSQDLQDVSIEIRKVTYNDSGLYICNVSRVFAFKSFMHPRPDGKNITLKVKEKASNDPTAFYSEIMMYVLLVFLTFWLLVEMVYCYRKISKSDEQAQDTATNYLAVPSEQKDNAAAPVTE